MKKDFGLDSLNSVMTIKLSTPEEKREFEEKIKETLKGSESGEILNKTFDLMNIVDQMKSEMSTEITEDAVNFLALEAFSMIHKKHVTKETEVISQFYRNFDHTDLVFETFEYENDKVTESLKRIEELSGSTDVLFKMMKQFDLEEDEDTVGSYRQKNIVMKTIKTGIKTKIKSNEKLSNEFLEILNDEKEKEFEYNKDIEFNKSFLDPSSVGKERLAGFEILDLPEFSIVVSSPGKIEDNYNKLCGLLLVRFEEDLEEVTLWHKKGLDFTEEIKYIEKFIQKYIKKIVLKDKFVD